MSVFLSISSSFWGKISSHCCLTRQICMLHNIHQVHHTNGLTHQQAKLCFSFEYTWQWECTSFHLWKTTGQSTLFLVHWVSFKTCQYADTPIQGFAKLSALEWQLKGQETRRSGVRQTPQDSPSAGVGSQELPSMLQPTQRGAHRWSHGGIQGTTDNEAVRPTETHQARVQGMGTLWCTQWLPVQLWCVLWGNTGCRWARIGWSSCTEHVRNSARQGTLFFDNFFSSVPLASYLLTQNTYCVATTRADRKDWPIQLKATKALNRQLQRRHHHSMIVYHRVQCLAWKDKKAIPITTTICKSSSTTTVNRKMKDGTRITVACPEAVQKYNTYMGGVDIIDRMRKPYSCKRRSRRWLLLLLFLGGHQCSEQPHHLPWNPTECKTYPEGVHPRAGRRTDGKPLFTETLSPAFVECAVISAILREALSKTEWHTRPVQSL